MYDTILVPTDGSSHARTATHHARTLATTVGATVHVLAVVDPNRYGGETVGDVSDIIEHQRQVRTEQAESVAADAAATLGPTVPVETHVREGRPLAEIQSVIEEYDVDAVAMGTHGRSGLKRRIFGSVTESVIRTVPTPILAVHDGDPPVDKYGDVLVPTDGSAYADAAVDHAIGLATAAGATIHTLYAGSAEHGIAAVETVSDRVAAATGEPAQTAISDEAPHDAIASYTTEHDIDLVTMGTHGRSGLQRQLLGSVTEQTIRRVQSPVLVVHRQNGEDQ